MQTLEAAREASFRFKKPEEIKQLTESAILLGGEPSKNIEPLIAIMSAYNLEVKDLSRVTDQLRAVSDRSRASIEDFRGAIESAGSTAQESRLSFTEYISLVGAVASATGKAGSPIGNFINMIAGRAEMPVQSRKAFALGVSTYDPEGKPRDIKSILNDVSAKFKEWGEESPKRKELAGVLGGVKNVNQFLGLMKGYEDMARLQASSINSLGEAARKNAEAMGGV